jgi:uncharacterized protein
MTQSSCIYVGHVTHHRLRPRVHRFRYRAFWLLLDLDDIDRLSTKLHFFSRNRFNFIAFFDRDHGDGGTAPLRTQAETILRNIGCRPDRVAAVKLLCMPRIMGYGFNPLSIYFCYQRDGALEAIIYEVHNTFGERHSYAIPGHDATSNVEQHCDKQFYVSPFLGIDMSYAFHVALPDACVNITIDGKEHDGPLITASLSGKRQELSDIALMKAFIKHPLLTLKVIAAIHWHALRLVLKGCRIHAREPEAHCPIPAVHRRAERKCDSRIPNHEPI